VVSFGRAPADQKAIELIVRKSAVESDRKLDFIGDCGYGGLFCLTGSFVFVYVVEGHSLLLKFGVNNMSEVCRSEKCISIEFDEKSR
jgi:hypothetical protein